MANMQDITRFILDNSGIKDTAGNFDPSSLKDLDKQIKEISRALESATNSVIHVTKQIDDTGKALVSFDVPKNTASNANAVWSRTVAGIETRYGYVSGSLLPMTGGVPSPATQDMRMLEFNKNFYGTKAKQELKSLMEVLGGEATTNPSKAYKDRMRIRVPISEQDYQNALIRAGGDDTKAREALAKSYTSRNLKSAVKYSDDVRDNIKEAKQAEEQKKAEKDNKASRLKMLGIIGLVVKGLQVIADITRRILTATLANASEVKKESLNAKSLGITYSNMREYKAQAGAMGMKEDVFSNAIASLQSALGDPSNLNTKAIGELAKVMSSDVIKGIQIALGNNDPESAMASILNAYYERGQNGINSVGMNVGRYQAERELATALEKAGFNDLAEILRNMFYTNDTGIYKGRISTGDSFADYMGLITAYTMGLTAVDNKTVSELGQVIDGLKEKFNELKDNLEKGLLIALGGIINKINNWDIGKSAEEKAKDTQTNIQSNQQALKAYTAKASIAEQAYKSNFEKAGIDFSKMGGKSFSSVDEYLAFRKTSQGRYWHGTTDEEKAEEEKLYQFLRTPEGMETIQLIQSAEVAREKVKLAEDNITKGIKTGKTIFNATDFTEAKFQQDVKSGITGTWFSDKSSAVNLLYNIRGNNAHSAFYDNASILQAVKDIYFGGENISYENALKTGEAGSLTEELYNKAMEVYKGKYPEQYKKAKKMSKEDVVRKAISEKTLSHFDVDEILSANVGKTGYGISLGQWGVAKDFLVEKGLQSFESAGGASSVLAQAMAMKQAQAFMAKAGANNVIASIGGYDEKTGEVTVTLVSKDEKSNSIKEILKFATDSVLGKKENYEFDLSGTARDGVRKATAQ